VKGTETDWPAIWSAVAAGGSVASAAVAAWAARVSKRSATQANEASAQAAEASRILASVEEDRRRSELTPRFRVTCQLTGNIETQLLRVMLIGPPGLKYIDGLTVTIRDDHFRRGDGQLLAAGPTREEIKAQIWGPYKFVAGTGPDDARADETGRTTVYDHRLPVGEELPYFLDETMPPPWGRRDRESWRHGNGTLIRLALTARHDSHGEWTLPCEIEAPTGTKPVTVLVPDHLASSRDIT
jgi:hypothetical protein